ncbi:MAG TPA: cytochrome C oxidase subunit IV family protein [Acidobacteriota bacterium]|nr:cytochrome C oxidase subunit IV family protein [Acidobacteriota bacterium]
MSDHVIPTRVYYTVFAALLVLTALTVLVAEFDLGRLNAFVAMLIACTKAMLVILYFMHVRYSSRLTQVFIGVAFLFLLILISFTMSDMLTRNFELLTAVSGL